MNAKTKDSKKLRELIRIGIFTALWIAVSWVLACTIGFFPPVMLVLPCILAVLGTMILVVMQSRMNMRGGILISSFLFGLCLYTMAPYGLMFFFTLAGGIAGEIVYDTVGRKGNAGKMTGFMCPMFGLALGEYIPLCYLKEAYKAAYAGSITEDTLNSLYVLFDKVTLPVMVILLIATILCSFFGFWWGIKIINNRLAKASGNGGK